MDRAQTIDHVSPRAKAPGTEIRASVPAGLILPEERAGAVPGPPRAPRSQRPLAGCCASRTSSATVVVSTVAFVPPPSRPLRRARRETRRRCARGRATCLLRRPAVVAAPGGRGEPSASHAEPGHARERARGHDDAHILCVSSVRTRAAQAVPVPDIRTTGLNRGRRRSGGRLGLGRAPDRDARVSRALRRAGFRRSPVAAECLAGDGRGGVLRGDRAARPKRDARASPSSRSFASSRPRWGASVVRGERPPLFWASFFSRPPSSPSEGRATRPAGSSSCLRQSVTSSASRRARMSGRDGRGGMDAKAGSAAEAEESVRGEVRRLAGESLGALVPAALVPAALVPAAASPGRPAKLLRITRSPLRDDRRMGSSADAGVHATCSSAETRTPPEPPPPSPSVAVPRLLAPRLVQSQASAGFRLPQAGDDFATSRAISGRHVCFVRGVLRSRSRSRSPGRAPPRACRLARGSGLPPSRSVPAAAPRDRDSCALRGTHTCAWSSSSAVL